MLTTTTTPMLVDFDRRVQKAKNIAEAEVVAAHKAQLEVEQQTLTKGIDIIQEEIDKRTQKHAALERAKF